MKNKIEFFYVKKGRGKILQAKGTAYDKTHGKLHVVLLPLEHTLWRGEMLKPM